MSDDYVTREEFEAFTEHVSDLLAGYEQQVRQSVTLDLSVLPREEKVRHLQKQMVIHCNKNGTRSTSIGYGDADKMLLQSVSPPTVYSLMKEAGEYPGFHYNDDKKHLTLKLNGHLEIAEPYKPKIRGSA